MTSQTLAPGPDFKLRRAQRRKKQQNGWALFFLGPWLLGVQGSGFVLRYREKERLHSATVAKDGGAWAIGSVTTA